MADPLVNEHASAAAAKWGVKRRTITDDEILPRITTALANEDARVLEDLAVFDTKSGQGSVTAGNSSQLSDGASATLVMSRERAKAVGAEPLLVFRGYAVSGCEPDEMGIGPVYAAPKLLKKHGLKVDDINVWELNEAFASEVELRRPGGSVYAPA